MTGAIDLSNLREITGGDVDVERELFDLFLQSADECIAALKNSADTPHNDEWRKQAHAFKGTSLNLGAGELGRLCKEAQEKYQAAPDEKRALLAAIESEFGRVKTQLEIARQEMG
jgi:histidine phosphotransfer protein HptB